MGRLDEMARRVIDGNRYMTLATADGAGRPWVSPVWFAHIGHTDLVWVSKLHRQHSRNIAKRPEVSVVIYDSTQVPGAVEAVYGVGRAAPSEEDAHLEAFSARSLAQGMPAWDRARVSGTAELRAFHLVVEQMWVLDDADDRVPVAL